MSKHMTIEEIIAKAEKEVRKNSSAQQVTQSFTGTLRVQPAKVFVSTHDGERALKELKRSRFVFRTK